MRLRPAGSRASPAASGRSTATSRSAAAPWTASPTPLREMGARIDARDGRFAAVHRAREPLRGIEYTLPVAWRR